MFIICLEHTNVITNHYRSLLQLRVASDIAQVKGGSLSAYFLEYAGLYYIGVKNASEGA